VHCHSRIRIPDIHCLTIDCPQLLQTRVSLQQQTSEVGAFRFLKFCNPKKPGAIGDSGSLLETDKGPIINFGNKHPGRLVSDVAVDDPGYLNWMLDKDFDPGVKLLISKALGR